MKISKDQKERFYLNMILRVISKFIDELKFTGSSYGFGTRVPVITFKRIIINILYGLNKFIKKTANFDIFKDIINEEKLNKLSKEINSEKEYEVCELKE